MDKTMLDLYKIRYWSGTTQKKMPDLHMIWQWPGSVAPDGIRSQTDPLQMFMASWDAFQNPTCNV